MNRILLVFLGGGLGSSFRYLIGILLNRNDFLTPYGTFFVNVFGSFLIGILAGYNLRTLNLNHEYQALLIAGFLGGFTTFSSFAFENLVMIQSGKFLLFAAYFITTLIVGLFAVGLGYYISGYIK
jgi:CrcB protein